jgi:hypothetical protein
VKVNMIAHIKFDSISNFHQAFVKLSPVANKSRTVNQIFR